MTDSYVIPSLVAWKKAARNFLVKLEPRPPRMYRIAEQNYWESEVQNLPGRRQRSFYVTKIFDGAVQNVDGMSRMSEYERFTPYFEIEKLSNGDHVIVVTDLEGLIREAELYGFTREMRMSLKLVVEKGQEFAIEELKKNCGMSDVHPRQAPRDVELPTELDDINDLVDALSSYRDILPGGDIARPSFQPHLAKAAL